MSGEKRSYKRIIKNMKIEFWKKFDKNTRLEENEPFSIILVEINKGVSKLKIVTNCHYISNILYFDKYIKDFNITKPYYNIIKHFNTNSVNRHELLFFHYDKDNSLDSALELNDIIKHYKIIIKAKEILL